MVFILPLIPLAIGLFTVAAGGTGVLAGVGGMADESKAKEIVKDAKDRYESVDEIVKEVREETQRLAAQYGELQLNVQQNTIGHFLDLRERIGQICSHQDRALLESFEGAKPQQFREYQSIRLDAIAFATQGVISDELVGDIADKLVKIAAKQGTLALVGMFGSASTGTAISGLSGAAAHSAALAWLGGGSIASGGGGMALGAIMLNGIAIGPSLLVGGFILAAKGDNAIKEALDIQAKTDIAIDELEIEQKFQEKVQDRICEIGNLVEGLNNRAIDILGEFESKSFDLDRDTAKFKTLALLIKASAEIMKAPIVDTDGNLNQKIEVLINTYKLLCI
jgi:hypothetical protein